MLTAPWIEQFIPYLPRVWLDPTKGDVIPTPESESEYDSRPSYTPDSGTGSFALESLEPVPSLVPAQLVG